MGRWWGPALLGHTAEGVGGGGSGASLGGGSQPASSGPEPPGVGGRHCSAAQPVGDRGGGVAGMSTRPQCRGLNPFKPSQTDLNKFEFNLNSFKLILIQT
jgi:hypothetical protein